jgi:hypothetical protein
VALTIRFLISPDGSSAHHTALKAITSVIALLWPAALVDQQIKFSTEQFGLPVPDGGSVFNTGSWNNHDTDGTFTCCDCLSSFFCIQCAVGTMMEQTMGMPRCLGCCCVSTYAARNHPLRLSNQGKRSLGACAIPCCASLGTIQIPTCQAHGCMEVE